MNKKELFAVTGLAAAVAVWACVAMFDKTPDVVRVDHSQEGYSPDEIDAQSAIAVIADVEQSKDFSTFVYQCDKIRHFVVLLQNADTTPKVRLVMASNLKEDGSPLMAKHRYLPESDGWSFTDTASTHWKIEAGQVTAGDAGTYKGFSCKFNVEMSAKMQEASEKETPEQLLSHYGA